MSEIDQLKERIENSRTEGVETAHIRDDYEPAGQMMINNLVLSGEFITRREATNIRGGRGEWKIFAVGYEPN